LLATKEQWVAMLGTAVPVAFAVICVVLLLSLMMGRAMGVKIPHAVLRLGLGEPFLHLRGGGGAFSRVFAETPPR
jgi:hypothetical protein